MIDPLVGQTLAGAYRVLERLDGGGFAEVYLARDIQRNAVVAVKVLRAPLAADPDLLRRFRREAELARHLDHPNIVRVLDSGQDRGLFFLVMEFVTGFTLDQLVRDHGPLPAAQVVEIGQQALTGLAAAHAAGIIHRDIKSRNLMLMNGRTLKIMDFGIARDETAGGATVTGRLLGSPPYMAPEQITGGTVDARTDLYGLGCVLYELLVGRSPFEGNTAWEVLRQQVEAPPPPLRQLRPDVPPALDAVVRRALAKLPSDRFPDAAAMRAALLATGAPAVVPAPPAKPTTSAPAPALAEESRRPFPPPRPVPTPAPHRATPPAPTGRRAPATGNASPGTASTPARSSGALPDRPDESPLWFSRRPVLAVLGAVLITISILSIGLASSGQSRSTLGSGFGQVVATPLIATPPRELPTRTAAAVPLMPTLTAGAVTPIRFAEIAADPGVNVRAAPNVGSFPVGHLPFHARVQVLAVAPPGNSPETASASVWLYVQPEGGTFTGWVRSDLIRVHTDSDSAALSSPAATPMPSLASPSQLTAMPNPPIQTLLQPTATVQVPTAFVPTPTAIVSIRLTAISPERTQAGHGFNFSPGHGSVIVAIGETLQPGTVIVFGGIPLRTDYDPTFLSAFVEPELYFHPQQIEVYLQDGVAESNRLPFTVEP